MCSSHTNAARSGLLSHFLYFYPLGLLIHAFVYLPQNQLAVGDLNSVGEARASLGACVYLHVYDCGFCRVYALLQYVKVRYVYILDHTGAHTSVLARQNLDVLIIMSLFSGFRLSDKSQPTTLSCTCQPIWADLWRYKTFF